MKISWYMWTNVTVMSKNKVGNFEWQCIELNEYDSCGESLDDLGSQRTSENLNFVRFWMVYAETGGWIKLVFRKWLFFAWDTLCESEVCQKQWHFGPWSYTNLHTVIFYIYTVSQKNTHAEFLCWLWQTLTNFNNSFTVALWDKLQKKPHSSNMARL